MPGCNEFGMIRFTVQWVSFTGIESCVSKKTKIKYFKL